MQFQQNVVVGDDLAQAIESGTTHATCSPPSLLGRGFGYDMVQQGRAYTVNGCDTRSGIPQALLGEVGRLTGRYIVPAGCGRHAARWEVKAPNGVYLWVEIEQ